MLENGDFEVPLGLPNRSLTVQGRVRVFRDEDASCLEVRVHEALEKKPGPTIIPDVEESPELTRTILAKRGG